MTNSPPSNVHQGNNGPSLAPYTVLASGIDTLHLNYSLKWESMNFLNSLKNLKEEAKVFNKPVLVKMETEIPAENCVFEVKPIGVGGYAYLLTSDEYALKLMHLDEDSPDTLTRPPVNAEFRSLLLHGMGAKGAEARLQNLLASASADIISTHVSRVDLFCDILIPEAEWGDFIRPFLVSRAKDIGRYDSGHIFSGFTIGRGTISARFYDKPLEIIKSKKFWMYDKWDIPVNYVPPGMRIIRVEFQLRREKVKELGIDTFLDLKTYIPKLWAYCTQEWLKVMGNPDKHTTRRSVLPWWKAVQNGFLGLPAGKPLIVARKVEADRKKAYRNVLGHLSSYYASEYIMSPLSLEQALIIVDTLGGLIPEIKADGFSGEDFLQMVLDKCSRYNRSGEKYSEAIEARDEDDFSFMDNRKKMEDIPF